MFNTCVTTVSTCLWWFVSNCVKYWKWCLSWWYLQSIFDSKYIFYYNNAKLISVDPLVHLTPLLMQFDWVNLNIMFVVNTVKNVVAMLKIENLSNGSINFMMNPLIHLQTDWAVPKWQWKFSPSTSSLCSRGKKWFFLTSWTNHANQSS